MRVADEKIYGPGMIDMKGGIALIRDILAQLTTAERKHIQIIFNDDEETGSLASKDTLLALTKQARAILIFEPGLPDGAVVTSHGGYGSYRLDVKGRAAHAGLEPLKGFSACTELSLKILAAAKLSNPANRVNVNPGIIAGGTKHNVVCENAYAILDVRFQTPKQFEEITQSLDHITHTLFSQHIPAGFTPTATITQMSFRPPFTQQKSAHLFAIYESLAKRLAITTKGEYVSYVTDASSVVDNQAEILLGLGPYGGGMHTSEEFLLVASYNERLKLNTLFIKTLLASYHNKTKLSR